MQKENNEPPYFPFEHTPQKPPMDKKHHVFISSTNTALQEEGRQHLVETKKQTYPTEDK